jgi:hypothetical protein
MPRQQRPHFLLEKLDLRRIVRPSRPGRQADDDQNRGK